MSSSSEEKNPNVDESVSFGEVLDFFSERWVLLAINSLMDGSRHFNELGRDCGGASGKVLIQKLGKMEQLGIVERTVLSVTPPSTSYALTSKGFLLRPVIGAIDGWARRYLPAPLDWDTNQGGEETHEGRQPIQLLQQKWVLRIVLALLESGSAGYNELSRIVGVNVTTLGHRLREMEAGGLIDRTVVTSKPLRYSYTLTAAGAALQTVLKTTEQWVSQAGVGPMD
ncbi:winged helix-turn-helix transcriptional regulator [Persicitalea sp.]|uniref:winged helix-turn-helix transcriptional regulator n=1 Tax=Persicitalea sp. TaxID=3100273 RepID=UPI003593AE22